MEDLISEATNLVKAACEVFEICTPLFFIRESAKMELLFVQIGNLLGQVF